MKKFISLIMSLCLLCCPLNAFAYQMEVDETNINAKSVVLMDMDSRQVLYEENEYEELSPASVTKIMSILLVLEALDSGKITLDDEVSASEDAVSMGGSQIWLEVGEIMTVNELLKAVIVASANDACTALGDYVAGSSVSFVKMMNDKANELGLEHTNFENCTGLDDTTTNHYSCAYDLAIIASEVMKYDLVKDYSTIWLDSLRDGVTELNNTNKLVNTYDGITGLKTGTTSNAGFCVCATASRDDMNLVAVVLGSDTSENRFDTASYLLDMGFANYKKEKISFDENELSSIKVKNGKEKYVELETENIDSILLPKNSGDIEYNYNILSEISAPVNKGDELGTIDIMNDGEIIDTIKVLSKENVEKISFWDIVLLVIRNI